MHRDMAALPVQEAGFTPFVPWQEAQEGDLLYAFTTYYNEETGGRLAANRAFNIEKAAGLLENLVVPRDGAFSFNQVCAPYLKSKGYQLAPIIGGNGKGYGGGVCQLSTTLYNAALGLPLRIDKWEVHRKRGVEYVPQYFDAAVGDYSDLAFTNLLPYPLRLSVLPQEGALTVLFYREGGQGRAQAK
ncbi:MAG: VanW family protein [Clostridiales bacterium]|nr:VanW family protein [Clostridiales bacterium]